MPIGPGTRVGPYEVAALLGEGGMGQVWRAHHVALKRDDALKVLPDAFAADPERLARFQREAELLARVNHPNVAQIYGLEGSDGTTALVMELVDGPTLADRILRGPIPMDEALALAKQIAAALEAAHEQGIVHRDLKPAMFFGRQGNLMAQRFDPDNLRLSGEATRVAQGLGLYDSELGNMAFSVSNSGSIAWWSETPFAEVQPTWVDRAGRRIATIGEPGLYFGLMPSPNGKYAATERIDVLALTGDILLLDLTGGNPSRLTFVPYGAGNPVWSPDSKRVLFTQWRDHLDVMPVEGGVSQQIPLPGGGNSDYPLSWSPDDRNLLFMRFTPETRFDLWILPMSGDRPPYLYLQTGEFNGRISPDGHWVAYGSNESGRSEVFVQSFPVPGNKRRISTSGGNAPMWRQDGRELYFVTEDHTLMAVSVTPRSAGSLEFSSPSRLFQAEHITGGARPTYAPSVDGQRFLVLVPVEHDRPQGINLIHNWRP